MTDFSDRDSTKALFLALAAEKPNLSAALNDPLVDTFAALVSQASVSVNYRLDRAEQDGYLMTAVSRSAVLSKSEDRQYTPRKSIPAQGTLSVLDKTKSKGGLPSGIALLYGARRYYTLDSITFDAGGLATVPVSQVEVVDLDFTVDVASSFYQLIIPLEYSSRIADIAVYVDGEKWTYKKRFRNVAANEKAYDEFYSSADEYGVRFGTGVVGKIPPVNSSIRIKLFLTEGETTLIAGEKLKLADASQFKDVEFVVSEIIAGGSAQEGLESIRIKSLYYEVFDEQYVWDEDYAFLLERNIPELAWVNVWGEAHQEFINGAPNVEFINRIYISAYCDFDGITDPVQYNATASERVYSAVSGIPQLNKTFVFVPPVESTFSISIDGTIQRNWTIEDARNEINALLVSLYGKNSQSRKPQPFKRDIYEGLRALKVFDRNYEVEVSISGKLVPDNKMEFIYLDEVATNSAITLGYS